MNFAFMLFENATCPFFSLLRLLALDLLLLLSSVQ